ncbi:MAG: lysophospholipid acyltransferase family protein [Gammaproteobacteria bacterium]
MTPPNPRFEWRFLLPKFWSTWALLLLLRMTLCLPRVWVMALGGFLGDCMRRRNRKRRRNAEINLAMCFPELDARARRRMVVAHFRHYGRGLLDMAMVFWSKPARLDALCTFERRDWLRGLFDRRRVIVVAYHQTTLEIGAAMLARLHSCLAMMKRDGNPLLNWHLWKGRMRQSPDMWLVMREQGLRPVLRALQQRRPCFLVADEDFGAQARSEFAPFFGVPTATMGVVARLARRSGARVVPCATGLDARSGRYVIRLGAPLENFPGNDARAAAAALNRAMEALIRRAPEQYMWSSRWFAHRPDGQPSPYDGRRAGGDERW